MMTNDIKWYSFFDYSVFITFRKLKWKKLYISDIENHEYTRNNNYDHHDHDHERNTNSGNVTKIHQRHDRRGNR
jgi:hypothetical protein